MGRTAAAGGVGVSSPEALAATEQELREKQGELNAVVEQRREVGAKLLAAEKMVAHLQVELPKAVMEVSGEERHKKGVGQALKLKQSGCVTKEHPLSLRSTSFWPSPFHQSLTPSDIPPSHNTMLMNPFVGKFPVRTQAAVAWLAG